MLELLSKSFGLLVTPVTSGITVPVKGLITILYPKRKKHNCKKCYIHIVHDFFADSKKFDMIRDQKIEFSPLLRGWGSEE